MGAGGMNNGSDCGGKGARRPFSICCNTEPASGTDCAPRWPEKSSSAVAMQEIGARGPRRDLEADVIASLRCELAVARAPKRKIRREHWPL
jgi:hypothetical protein